MKDIGVFWKTQMFYCVRTDYVFRSLLVESGDFNFYLDVEKKENKRTNKNTLIFKLNKIKEDNKIVFNIQ